ncbi:TldD/PmbA family protein [Dehalobacter sp. DCM]|uniref:TldD/PmbA family protein n=1 Tax=Dehalobacter sp. DCM TaxID=2907827 RepID=UPI003081957D|nr:TldD/PmbA family protein [Dehalobacter sp. DCM]
MNPESIRAIVEKTVAQVPGGYLIVRAQSLRERSVRFNNGSLQNLSIADESGIGVQAFTRKGACGFASVNFIDDHHAERTAWDAFRLAEVNEKSGCDLNTAIFDAVKVRDAVANSAEHPFDSFTPEDLQMMTASIHNNLMAQRPEQGTLSWQTSFRLIEEFWCIGRTDGTLVSFFVPRAVLSHHGTVKEGDKAQSFAVNRSGVDAGVLLAEKTDSALYHKAVDKANFIYRVALSSAIPFGSYPLVIDHALAKGLAHEAFGHAVESDLVEESVLSSDGKLKIGLPISNPAVGIIDGPLPEDWAYQPYSANGIRRETVEIVKKGILAQGLGDIFSAQKAGIPVTGAGRSEYYGSVSLPRMTNIRLMVSNKMPLPPSTHLPEEIRNLRQTLMDNNTLAKDHHYLLLGYRGGQVNIKTGDFVFQCDGAVNLADPDLGVYNPGIFSGKILSVLESVRSAIGDEHYHAIGTCGKSGQGVPSSGGGNGYILLDSHPNVKLGGKDDGK